MPQPTIFINDSQKVRQEKDALSTQAGVLEDAVYLRPVTMMRLLRRDIFTSVLPVHN